jgi:hypothetical protein
MASTQKFFAKLPNEPEINRVLKKNQWFIKMPELKAEGKTKENLLPITSNLG